MNRSVPRLKWHMLRRRKSDPAFQRENLIAALRAGAACEVDVMLTADGHAVCLHDRTLERETNGRGRVAETARADIERLRQRGPDGTALPSAPLFLDELVATVESVGANAGALVQLDVKVPSAALSTKVLDTLSKVLANTADAFIASAYDWETVQRIVARVPGLNAGYDPLATYPRSFASDADGFRKIAHRMYVTAPGAAFYYIEAKLILAALEYGVDLVRETPDARTRIDAWTIDADAPALECVLARLIDLGCHQITTNDPEQLLPIVERLSI